MKGRARSDVRYSPAPADGNAVVRLPVSRGSCGFIRRTNFSRLRWHTSSVISTSKHKIQPHARGPVRFYADRQNPPKGGAACQRGCCVCAFGPQLRGEERHRDHGDQQQPARWYENRRGLRAVQPMPRNPSIPCVWVAHGVRKLCQLLPDYQLYCTPLNLFGSLLGSGSVEARSSCTA